MEKSEKGSKARIYKGFYINSDEDGLRRIKRMEELRSRDCWSETRLILESIDEYLDRHLPGNPALPLDHWTGNQPLSIAAQEKLQPNRKLTLSSSQVLENCSNCKGSGKGECGQVCYSCRGDGQVVVTKYV